MKKLAVIALLLFCFITKAQVYVSETREGNIHTFEFFVDGSKCMEEVAPGHHGHSINPRPTFLMPPLSFNCVNNWSKMPLMNPWLLGVL